MKTGQLCETAACVIVFLSVAANPNSCQAAISLSLGFGGEVLANSGGSIVLVPYGPMPPSMVSFVGEPVNIAVSVVGNPADLYVNSFSISWSNQTYTLPYITSAGGIGFPNDCGACGFGFQSSVNLGPSGGSISIFPTGEWEAFTDGSFGLQFSFSFSKPQNPYGSFIDDNLSGGGNVSEYLPFSYDPSIGFYDSTSNVNFALSSLTQVSSIPEPSTWVMALVGFAGLGYAGWAKAKRRLDRD